MDLSQLNKKELLEKAAGLNIVGRHKMGVDELRAALALSGQEEVNGEVIKAVKKRRQSRHQRDTSGKVIREGKNLSGNTPFRHKFYYLDPKVASEEKWTQAYRDAEAAAPMQVRLILKYMRVARINKEEASQIGGDIVSGAISRGLLKTKIAPENLFAYYRRVLEPLGVTHAEGFELDEGGEDEGEE